MSGEGSIIFTQEELRRECPGLADILCDPDMAQIQQYHYVPDCWWVDRGGKCFDLGALECMRMTLAVEAVPMFMARIHNWVNTKLYGYKEQA